MDKTNNELEKRLAALRSSIIVGMTPEQVIEVRRLVQAAARIGAEVEREECAKVCDPEEGAAADLNEFGELFATWIRARGTK